MCILNSADNFSHAAMREGTSDRDRSPENKISHFDIRPILFGGALEVEVRKDSGLRREKEKNDPFMFEQVQQDGMINETIKIDGLADNCNKR